MKLCLETLIRYYETLTLKLWLANLYCISAICKSVDNLARRTAGRRRGDPATPRDPSITPCQIQNSNIARTIVRFEKSGALATTYLYSHMHYRLLFECFAL